MTFYLYGFFVGLGIVAGAWVSEQVRKTLNTKYCSLNTSAYDVLPWVLIPGIIGARAYHVLDYWQYYGKNPIDVLFLWQGGLGIYGGLFGGLLGLYALSFFISWKELKKEEIKKLRNWKLREFFPQYLNISISNFLKLADLAAFGLPVGQAIGRLGNYFNQELYGWPTSLPWGIYIKEENRLPGFESFQKFHPLFAYEGLWCLIIFLILLKKINLLNTKYCILNTQKLKGPIAKNRCLKPGRLFFAYLGLYSFGRFWLEFLRINPWQIEGVNVAQGISVGLIVISLIRLIRLI